MPWELVGFFFLATGTFIYNEIWIVPIDFMSKNTKAMIAKREHVPADDANYMSSSPAAAYDATRNKRNINARMDER